LTRKFSTFSSPVYDSTCTLYDVDKSILKTVLLNIHSIPPICFFQIRLSNRTSQNVPFQSRTLRKAKAFPQHLLRSHTGLSPRPDHSWWFLRCISVATISHCTQYPRKPTGHVDVPAGDIRLRAEPKHEEYPPSGELVVRVVQPHFKHVLVEEGRIPRRTSGVLHHTGLI
jgi:hypothetical protein